MEATDLWTLEREYYGRGWSLICGVDEAGAGPLAGPVYAAAVILPRGWSPKGLGDSKKMSARARERLYNEITAGECVWAVSAVSEEEIDRINILNARMLAMERAIASLTPRPDFALIDGDKNRGITLANVPVVKGDSKSASIAAASILAKVSRDRHMVEQDALYPKYGFARHKGYGTALHFEALRACGPCPIHRKTFLKNV